MAYELTCIWTNGKRRNFSWIVLCSFICMNGAPPVAQMVKNRPATWETWVRSLDQEDPLEKGMATHSSVLAWRIPWTEEPGGLQSMGSQRVGHDWATNTHTHTHTTDSHTHTHTHTHTHIWVSIWNLKLDKTEGMQPNFWDCAECYQCCSNLG